MATFKHIVQVHPVENGNPNLHKVTFEKEFDTQDEADSYINTYNKNVAYMWKRKKMPVYAQKAVYHGRVNDATGELE